MGLLGMMINFIWKGTNRTHGRIEKTIEIKSDSAIKDFIFAMR